MSSTLPAEPEEPDNSGADRRSRSLKNQIDAFIVKLNDFTRKNPLLYYRDKKTGTLRLPPTTAKAILGLLREDGQLALSEASARDLESARATLQGIRRKAQEAAEERGLQSLFVALGFATWPGEDTARPTRLRVLGSAPPDKSSSSEATDGRSSLVTSQRQPLAPMILLPVSLKDSSRPGDDPKIVRAGELQINGALVAYVGETYGISIDVERLIDSADDDLTALTDSLRQSLAGVPGITFDTNAVLSNFDFQKMAMVADLRENYDVIAKSDLVCAIAGDVEAQTAIARAQDEADRAFSGDLDAIPPSDELFVIDADSSQQRVLHGILRSTTHAVIQGPPGTGKSQTIANLIAALIGSGKSVLFVAEKRTALEAVFKRLRGVGLDHLVLDLHGADVKRKQVYDVLARANERAGTVPLPVVDVTFRDFQAARTRLNEHDLAMHENREPYACSLYELMVRLAAIPESWRCQILLNPVLVDRLTPDKIESTRVMFRDAGAVNALFLRDPQTPWAQADFKTSAEADRATELVSTLASSLSDVLGQTMLLSHATEIANAQNFDDIREIVARARAVGKLKECFTESILDANPKELCATLEPHVGSPFARFLAVFDSRARTAFAVLKASAQGSFSEKQRFVALRAFVALPAEWRTSRAWSAIDGEALERLGSQVEQVLAAIPSFRAFVRTGEVDHLTPQELYTKVVQFDQARNSAYRVVAATKLRDELTAMGLASIVDEIKRAQRTPDSWPDLFESAWLRSSIERISVLDNRLATFDRVSFEATIENFKRLDIACLSLAASRIQRSAAERYLAAQRNFPGEAIKLRENIARRRGHLPLRQLMEVAGNVVTALSPCWMASPLSVSQLTSVKRKFDIVIFDEASQVEPQEAITSIIRGARVVVAGDRYQLPPTSFFGATARGDSDDDDEEESEIRDGAKDVESLLDLMSIYVRPKSLDWHYRSRDERLIAFSNNEFYGNRLITFPSREIPPPAMRHVLVDNNRDGNEESSSAEVLRVVELILEHARTRPDESLGVIAMGIKHATRIENELYERRRQSPELDAFFGDHGDRSFFCKNLERVQGDERDAIILTIGYSKNARGQMVYRFGPLNNDGGERRLNVAISRAVKRLTLVTSFASIDMDDSKLNAVGAKMLKRYIRFVESGGRDLGYDVTNEKIPMNEFEEDIFHCLTSRGLDLVPQFGVSSYRLDFAVRNPKAPGSYLLAIECDGATYHSAQTARDRDRIRQHALELQGWVFHRIWSTDWFTNRMGEIDRAVVAYEAAIKREEEAPKQTVVSERPKTESAGSPVTTVAPPPVRKQAKPPVNRGPIDRYSDAELCEIIRYVKSDDLLRNDEQLLEETKTLLGFQRLGPVIKMRILAAIRQAEH